MPCLELDARLLEGSPLNPGRRGIRSVLPVRVRVALVDFDPVCTGRGWMRLESHGDYKVESRDEEVRVDLRAGVGESNQNSIPFMLSHPS